PLAAPRTASGPTTGRRPHVMMRTRGTRTPACRTRRAVPDRSHSGSTGCWWSARRKRCQDMQVIGLAVELDELTRSERAVGPGDAEAFGAGFQGVLPPDRGPRGARLPPLQGEEPVPRLRLQDPRRGLALHTRQGLAPRRTAAVRGRQTARGEART